jgi:hypothetical protein
VSAHTCVGEKVSLSTNLFVFVFLVGSALVGEDFRIYEGSGPQPLQSPDKARTHVTLDQQQSSYVELFRIGCAATRFCSLVINSLKDSADRCDRLYQVLQRARFLILLCFEIRRIWHQRNSDFIELRKTVLRRQGPERNSQRENVLACQWSRGVQRFSAREAKMGASNRCWLSPENAFGKRPGGASGTLF